MRIPEPELRDLERGVRERYAVQRKVEILAEARGIEPYEMAIRLLLAALRRLLRAHRTETLKFIEDLEHED